MTTGLKGKTYKEKCKEGRAGNSRREKEESRLVASVKNIEGN
jgi:hypothetical protein